MAKKNNTEDLLSEDVKTYCDTMSALSQMDAIYTHIPMEAQPPKMQPFQALRFWEKKKRMGIRNGVPDWYFGWKGGHGWIELKAPKELIVSLKTGKTIQGKAAGKLSESQEDFQADCDRLGIKHAICDSVASVDATLKKWGVI